ncbi:MAG: potassium/proton antiporter [Ignavibacteria bacterium]|nr:potassium/proton antiporter [Ignavibacteria bacterium]
MLSLEFILLVISLLILISIFLTKLSDNFGVPSLVLFLVMGMIAGSDGPGQIEFNDYELTKSIGLIALVFILFSGGLDTKWKSVKTVFWSGLSLSTLGVVMVTISVGFFCNYFFGFGLIESFLLGAIISSTDVAAVFSTLRAKNTRLKGCVRPLLELESGSNDPMAIFLTVLIIEAIISGVPSTFSAVLSLIMQFGIGGIIAVISGKLMVKLFNKLKFGNDSLYVVFAIAFALLIYAITTLLKGSGMLAVYISAIIIGNSDFIQKRSTIRFFEGIALLSQIVMFLALGLLSDPSELLPVTSTGLIISGFLIFAARPISVFISLIKSKFSIKEKFFLSWVGLKGAVPIILSTFPIIYGIQGGYNIFNLVFFITLSSALLQGWSIPLMAKVFKLEEPEPEEEIIPIKMSSRVQINKEMIDLIIPYKSEIIGKPLADISLPEESLIVLITRNGEYVVPSGSTTLEEGDTLLVLVNKENVNEVKQKLMRVHH